MSTGNYPQELWPGLKSLFGDGYNEHGMECKDLFDWTTSDKAYEKSVERTGTGLAPRKPEGTSTTYDQDLQGYTSTATHSTYSLGIIATEEEIDDGQYESVMTTRTKALAFSMRQTKENVSANYYNNAFSAVCGDGQFRIDSDHPTRSGNQANLLTVAADLTEASLEDLCIQIANAKNNRGLRIALRPMKLIIPVSLMFDAKRILASDLQSGQVNNDVNALKAMGIFADGYTVNHYLTDADAFFIKTDCPDGLVGYQRKPVSFTQDNDFDTANFKAKGSERFSVVMNDWRALFGSPGA